MGAPILSITGTVKGKDMPDSHKPKSGTKSIAAKGTVHSVRLHEDGKHIHVELRHGPRKHKNGAYDDRPTSSFMVPIEHGHRFPVGSEVSLGLPPAASAAGGLGTPKSTEHDGDTDGDDGED